MACRQRVDADEEGPLARMVVAVGADAPGGGELVCKCVVWRGGSEAHAMEGGGAARGCGHRLARRYDIRQAALRGTWEQRRALALR